MKTKQVVYAFALLVVVALAAATASFLTRSSGGVAQTSPILKGLLAGSAYHYVQTAPYYTIEVTYPAQIPLNPPAAARAELVIEKAFADDIAQFKSDGNLGNLSPEDIQIQGLGPDRRYGYAAQYERYQSANSVSYVFTLVADTLGAHPNSFYRTFTFDTQGNEITLENIFKPGASYLPRISSTSYDQVVAQLKTKTGSDPTPDMLDTARVGTSPSPESLQFFYVDGDTLGLLFPPYQVAAYAAGSFEVRIPLATLADILR